VCVWDFEEGEARVACVSREGVEARKLSRTGGGAE
jgi:hypothetical protein